MINRKGENKLSKDRNKNKLSPEAQAAFDHWKYNELSIKQKRFVHEYLIDFNATRAYKDAGYQYKNSKVATQLGSRLLKNPKVKRFIDHVNEEKRKRCAITQDQVINELAKIAFADLKDYLEYRTEQTVVDYNEEGAPIVDYQQIIDVIDSKEVDTSVVQEVSVDNKGNFKFKLYDKQKALLDLGKHLGMFTEKIEHSGGVNIQQNPFDELSVEELKALAEVDDTDDEE